jgi:Na+/H+ antiporter NhaD/arsenite permease-like protein
MVSTLSILFRHPVFIWGLAAFSVIAALASILLVPRFLASLPVTYLYEDEQVPEETMLFRVLRNALGAVLVLLGLAMLVLPGQGLLTLLVGLFLIDFPGKHRALQRLLGRPKVLRVVNKLRAQRGTPPLVS